MVCEVDMITQYLQWISQLSCQVQILTSFQAPCTWSVWLEPFGRIFFCMLFEKIYNETIIGSGFRITLWVTKPHVCICLSLQVWQIMAQTLVLISLVKPFNLNIYFCEKCQKAQKLLVERQFFKQINPL